MSTEILSKRSQTHTKIHTCMTLFKWNLEADETNQWGGKSEEWLHFVGFWPGKGTKEAIVLEMFCLGFLVVAWVYVKIHWGMHLRLVHFVVCMLYSQVAGAGWGRREPAIEVHKNVLPCCPKTQNTKPEVVLRGFKSGFKSPFNQK